MGDSTNVSLWPSGEFLILGMLFFLVRVPTFDFGK